MNGYPILDSKRERECTERYQQSETVIKKMTPEQLQYYKSLPYKEGREFLEKILKGGNPIMNKIEPKITHEQLLQECKKYGTGKEALEAISQKYGLKISTLKVYIADWKILNELHPKSNQQPLQPGLHEIFKILKGENGTYKVSGNTVRITEVNGKRLKNTILLDKSMIKPFIEELQELDRMLN